MADPIDTDIDGDDPFVRAGELASELDLDAAIKAGIINDADRELLLHTREAVKEIIAVDEFEHEALAAGKAPETPTSIKAA